VEGYTHSANFFNQTINLLKAKGPSRHLHRSKIHDIKYIKTHKQILFRVKLLNLNLARFRLKTATLGLRTTAAGREFQMSTIRLVKN